MKRSNLFKRSAAMLLAGLMAVSMSACGGSSASGNDSGDSQASSSGDTHKLSVVLKTTSSEYWSYVIAGIEQAEKDHGKHQRDAGRSLLHVYSLFRGKYRISTPVFIIQRWIFYRSFEF